MVTPSCKMAVDVYSCVSCRWTKALVGFLLLLMTSHAGSQSSGDLNTGHSSEVNNRKSSESVIDATPISLGEPTVKLSAETILQQSQTTNQSLELDNAFTKTEIVHSSSVPINFSELSKENQNTEVLSSAQRLVRSIDSKLTTSQTLDSNSESSLNKKESLESSDKSRNQIDTNEIDNVGKKAGEYYRQIQPTKTISLHQLDDAKIVKTTAIEGKIFKEHKNSGEGYGAPRGRSLPLTEPETPTSSVGGTVTSNVSRTMEEGSTMKESETPGLPAASFRSGYDDRKTNSDIQDIITGIVKLLNGNVKVQANPNLPPGGMMGAGRPLRPLSTRINNRGPPRITDVLPLPLDFDTPGPVPHRPPPLPTSSRIPPPYPFDRPPAIVPLPPQPTELNHPGDHPFMSGVPLPELVVPMSNTKRPPQDNLGIVRPHRPRPHRPRPPPMGNKTRRPPPMPTIDLTQPFPQFRPDVNKKPHPEVSISLMEDHYEDSQEQSHTTASSQVPVTIMEEESGGEEDEVKVEEDIATISTPSSPSNDAPSVFSEEDASYVTTEDNKEELPSKAVVEIDESSDKVFSSKETSSSEIPKIIATLTSSSSTVNEATQEVKPFKEDDLPSITSSSELPILLEPSIGVGVATPVLESSMQEILTHDTTSSSESESHQATPTNYFASTLSTASSIVTTSGKETPSISTSSSKSPEKQQQSATEQDGGQGFPYYPYRPRPGIVLDDTEYKPGGVKNRPIITAPIPAAGGRPGDIFDVTVTAIQGPGGGNTGQPFVYPVEMEGVQLPGAAGSEVSVITKAEEGQHFVSIDGKRTYINLFGSSNEQGNVAPTRVQQNGHTHPPKQSASTIGTGYAIPETEETAVHPGMGHQPPAPPPPRRPYNRRPNHPPVRIDTCIVGDDSTCDSAQNEMCRTEVGVSSCHCRPGYSRRKHREPCRRIVSILMSLRVDRLYDKRVVWDGKLQDPDSEEYKTLEWESSRAIDSAMSMTPFSDDFMGVRVNGLYTLPGGSEPGGAKRGAVFVNLTLQLEESVETLRPAVRHDIQRHLLGVIHRRNNNVGHSALWVDSPPGSVSHLQDVDECSSRDLHDCHLQAHCSNIFGSFRCSCPEGYRDPWAGNPHRSGRQCETCPPEHCSSHGECRYEGGQPVCYCSSNFYGSQCEVDGEVLGVAVGASVAAVIIIVLTLVCLCMWSRRWSREQKTAAGMGSPVFGYMATGGSTVKTPAIGSPPYQVSLEDRLRWAQIADVMVQANHYAPEPVPGPTRPSSAMFGYPSLTMSGTLSHAGAPPVPLPRLGITNMSHAGAMSIHGGPALSTHGALSIHGGLSSHGMRTPDRTVESSSSEEEDRADLLGRNFHVPRPKSRSSVANQSGIYYDVDYEQENIYGTSKNLPAAIPLSTYTMSSRPPYFRQ